LPARHQGRDQLHPPADTTTDARRLSPAGGGAFFGLSRTLGLLYVSVTGLTGARKRRGEAVEEPSARLQGTTDLRSRSASASGRRSRPRKWPRAPMRPWSARLVEGVVKGGVQSGWRWRGN